MWAKIAAFLWVLAEVYEKGLNKVLIIFLLIFAICELLKDFLKSRKIAKVLLICLQALLLFVVINKVSPLFYPFLSVCMLEILVFLNISYFAFFALLSFLFLPKTYYLDFTVFTFLYGTSFIFEFYFAEKSKRANIQLDTERRLRYQLEEVKQRLICSQKEVEKLSVLKERERIARELHDSLGHTLSSLNIQLYALYKIVEKTSNISLIKDEVLERVNRLCCQVSSAIELVRKTVYEIKPESDILLEEIEKTVSSFEFCKVIYNVNKKTSNPPSHCLENFLAIIKEALTNICRHSDATVVEINIDLTEKYARLYIKDNGTKKGNIKEGLGLFSMKARALEMGGTINIDNSNGFMIVVFVPFAERRIIL
ncbi:sensor histidine kinase [Anaerocellum danielii]|uniref:histidine kinase n=1 Tax=Anaerocellum danielii TaxID=1387557 RepID=A0ABZ0TYP5_9FIRM|nr:histidine kinase [Caldicellulosiruptor danielii]WPX08586.1 histidine kinase [Caldicellulosiruptor danielii]